ncbi:serine hydrolase domain-containing protein [Rhodococcus qingshengii]|uniref:serine hydrolase domain-containing protein n=1 Tax=Rhodococcus qingshengii TaxID=334542 RepID=UPI0035F98504
MRLRPARGLLGTTLLVVAMALLPTQSAQAAPIVELDRSGIEKYVTDYMDQSGYPGVSIAITHGRDVLMTAGYGHDSTGADMTAETPMPVASVSKSFTALAVMQLVESGAVALDESVQSYLPDFEVDDPRTSKITVRELLNQTSGISDETLREKSLPQPHSLKAAEQRARDATLAEEPGTRHHYTNTNYHLAARLVEVVSQQPFADYLHERVLDPLDMDDTTSIDMTPDDLPRGVSKGHTYLYGISVAAPEPERFVSGSDGLITTADDMAKWLIMQTNEGIATDGERLATPESIDLMRSTPNDQPYGLGWDRDQKGRWGHSGVWFTYTAYQMLLPSGYGIAIMSNSGLGLGNESPYLLADGMAAILEGEEPQQIAATRLYIDLVLAAVTLLSFGLGVRTVRRAGAWAARAVRRRWWSIALRLAAWFVPLVLLIALPRLLGSWVGGGRDLTHEQLFLYSPALLIWFGVATTIGVVVVAARLRSLQVARRLEV